jgi:hypothetical protein
MPTNPVAVKSTEQPITGLDAARTFGEFAAALKDLPSSKLLEYRLAMLRRAITPATASSEERPLLCETPQTNQEERLKGLAKWEARLEILTEMVEEFEEFDELVNLRIFGGGNKKVRNERESRYLLLEYQLFGGDWCAPGIVDKELEDVRSSVMELGVDCDEVKELLRRIDAVAENMSDE